MNPDAILDAMDASAWGNWPVKRQRFRDILNRRYFTTEPVTSAQLSRDWGVSHSRAYQVEAEMLRRLRSPRVRKAIGLTDDGTALASAVFHGDNPTGRPRTSAGEN